MFPPLRAQSTRRGGRLRPRRDVSLVGKLPGFGLFALLLLLPCVAVAATDPPWVAEKEGRAREFVASGSAKLQSWNAAGSRGPKTFETDFREAEGLLAEIVAAAPTARRLYGLAYVRTYLDQIESAHHTCDRVLREYPGEADVIARCDALVAALHDRLFRVAVSSEPAGALVRVAGWADDAVVTTPGVVWLTEGRRELTFTLDGFLPQVRQVDVKAGFVTQVSAKLRVIPAMGQIVLTTSPAGAWLEVDQTPVPLPPSGVLDVEAGPRHIRVSLDGYTPFETTVRVTTDAPVELDVVLEPTAVEAPLVPDAPPVPVPAVPAGPARLAPWGWALVGVGAAAVAGGAGAHVLAALKAEDARGVPNRPDLRAEFEGLRDDARTAELAAYILYGAGAAVVVTGIVLLAVDPGPVAPPTRDARATVRAPQVTPILLPDGAGISVGLSF